MDRDSCAARNMLQLADDLFSHAVEPVRIIRIAEEGRVDDRHIVDLDWFDDPSRDTGRHAIQVLLDLVVQLDEAVFPVFAHEEPHRDHGCTRPGH